ncbi:hypothetical protein OEZ86_000453 [Tetradesmus obliquus]|nr:hypothetical protein OEZ86_000453 [Tetradesmus obliquus]
MAATTSRETAASSGCSKTAAALGESLCCGICYELLLDPVVGSCGHDFCKGCLDTWRSQQRQQGNNRVKCPVCRGSFAESFDKLGVCVRLRDMVELLFPERIAARRAELERQAALQKKRRVECFQQEDIPVPAAALGQIAEAQGRRRLHARRHQRRQPQQSVLAAASGPLLVQLQGLGVRLRTFSLRMQGAQLL